jgi:hypothetical protein
MAVPYKQLPPHRAYAYAQTREQMRDCIDSVWCSVVGSRRTIEEGREAIARADVVLARRLSDRRKSDG